MNPDENKGEEQAHLGAEAESCLSTDVPSGSELDPYERSEEYTIGCEAEPLLYDSYGFREDYPSMKTRVIDGLPVITAVLLPDARVIVFHVAVGVLSQTVNPTP